MEPEDYGRKDSLQSDQDFEKVEIFFSARNLADLDLLTVTDSFLIVYKQQSVGDKFQVLKTKIYWNDLNPDYVETLITEFFFQVRQKLIVEVYHEASPPVIVGTVQATIGQVFGSRSKGLKKEILDMENKSRGQLLIKCEKIEKGSNKMLQFNVRGINLLTSCFCFGPPQIFFKIFKNRKDVQYLLYQSQIKEGKDPQFNQALFSQKRLCNNDQKQKLTIKLFQTSCFFAPQQIGSAQFTIGDLSKKRITLLNKSSKNAGTLQFQDVKRFIKWEFTDFLISGMQMALVCCIDFTASNGIPSHPKSLHYYKPDKKSQYQQALYETTSILMDYDADKLVPVYGFGAKVRMRTFATGTNVHHCFPINGNQENPNLYQVDGIMKGYRECMKDLQFGGPTLFGPLLREAMKQCEQMKKQKKQYMILMILTDGAIYDIDEVQDLLVKCGRLPLSVIIVGIGHGQWGLMDRLDDNDCQMRDSNGNKTERDLVQFVEFAKYQNNGVKLAKDVFYELPRQVEDYNRLVGLQPVDYQANKQSDADIMRKNYAKVQRSTVRESQMGPRW